MPQAAKMPSTDDLIAADQAASLSTDDLIKAHQSEIKNSRQKYTAVESAGRGAAQGGSLGFVDEAVGAVKAIPGAMASVMNPQKAFSLSDLVQSYKAGRDEYRKGDALAKQDNPGSYTGGEIAGSIASSALPLGGVAKGTSLGQKVLGAAKIGAAQGLGTSNSDLTDGNLEGAVKDTLGGAATGATVQSVISPLAAVIKGITPTNLAKKAANIVLNTPEELTAQYIANPNAIKTAPRIFEVGRSFEESALPALQKLTTEGSAASRKILDKEGVTFNGSEIAAKAQEIGDRIEKNLQGINDDPQKLAALAWVRKIQNEFSPTITPGQKQNTGFLDLQGNPIIKDIPKVVEEKVISANRLKDSIQSIDRNTEYQIAPGQFAKIDDSVKKELRGEFDAFLKKSPAYTAQMAETADNAKLLNEARGLAGSDKGFTNVFKKVQTDKYGTGQLPLDVLENVDKKLGTTYLIDSKNAMIREAFDKSITNGSMNVNKFTGLLKDVPVLKRIGPIVGAVVDKYGRPLTMRAVDLAIKLEQQFQRPNIKDYIDAARPIVELAKQGNPTAIVTFQILSEMNPQSVRALQSQDAMQRRKGE